MSFFYPLNEYFRPWKLGSLSVGIALLVLGSIFTPVPDWDIPVSLIMAMSTYITAPCSLNAILRLRYRHWLWAIFFTWLSVDGLYAVYWYFRNPEALWAMRDANFTASLCLYGLCAGIWLYKGSLKQLTRDVKNAVKNHRRMV